MPEKVKSVETKLKKRKQGKTRLTNTHSIITNLPITSTINIQTH